MPKSRAFRRKPLPNSNEYLVLFLRYAPHAAKIFRMTCHPAAITFSDFLSLAAVLIALLSLFFSLREKLYVAKLFIDTQSEETGPPYIVVKVVNQGQIPIYPNYFDLVETTSKRKFSFPCEPVPNQPAAEDPDFISKMIKPGRSRRLIVMLPIELENAVFYLEDLRLDIALTLENNRIFRLKNQPLTGETLKQFQAIRESKLK